jgi:hypothetical protein
MQGSRPLLAARNRRRDRLITGILENEAGKSVERVIVVDVPARYKKWHINRQFSNKLPVFLCPYLTMATPAHGHS